MIPKNFVSKIKEKQNPRKMFHHRKTFEMDKIVIQVMVIFNPILTKKNSIILRGFYSDYCINFLKARLAIRQRKKNIMLMYLELMEIFSTVVALLLIIFPSVKQIGQPYRNFKF